MCGVDVLVKEFERIHDALFPRVNAPETPLNPFRTPFEGPPGAPPAPPGPLPNRSREPPGEAPGSSKLAGFGCNGFLGTISRKWLILKGVKKCCVFSFKVHLHRPGLGCNGFLAVFPFF